MTKKSQVEMWGTEPLTELRADESPETTKARWVCDKFRAWAREKAFRQVLKLHPDGSETRGGAEMVLLSDIEDLFEENKE